MCTNAWYKLSYKKRSPLHICIIKATFRDKHEPRSTQIIRLETTRSKQQIFVTLGSWWLLSEHTFIEDWLAYQKLIAEFSRFS